jgi:hypothetical protein
MSERRGSDVERKRRSGFPRVTGGGRLCWRRRRVERLVEEGRRSALKAGCKGGRHDRRRATWRIVRVRVLTDVVDGVELLNGIGWKKRRLSARVRGAVVVSRSNGKSVPFLHLECRSSWRLLLVIDPVRVRGEEGGRRGARAEVLSGREAVVGGEVWRVVGRRGHEGLGVADLVDTADEGKTLAMHPVVPLEDRGDDSAGRIVSTNF